MIVTGVMFLNLGIHMTDLTQLYVIASSCEAECDSRARQQQRQLRRRRGGGVGGLSDGGRLSQHS